jgi:hypothetical protein
MMSQKTVYELLEELGGRATTLQIRNLAKERYPEFTLHSYVANRLRKLQQKGYIKYDTQSKQWIIISKYPK